MSDPIDRLKARWVAECPTIRPGVSPKTLDAFEARYGVVLPPALRDYFAAVDGMVENLDDSDWVCDGDQHQFWPLAEFVPIRELRNPIEDRRRQEGLPAWADHWFAFADYLIYSHALAVRLTTDPADGGPVCVWDFEDKRWFVAPTFEAFLELYLSRSRDLYGSDIGLGDGCGNKTGGET